MKYSITVAVFAVSFLSLFGTTQVIAQTSDGEELSALEEIVVTGRKREETLVDIPVSASVLSSALIDEAGITDLYDFFELVPGLHYDEEDDRLAALPSIRGVQANDVASNRTKVTAFIDGIPVLGSIGSIGFNGFQQVEVYRGPQSAAFGRSTFAGAINYVTEDPGEEFAADVGFNINDFGTQVIDLNMDIPITERLGLRLSASHEDSGTPSNYSATANDGYKVVNGVETNLLQSDGTEYGARSGTNISGKLVFNASDDLKMSMTFAHVETDDQQSPTFFLTEEARNECFQKGGLYADAGMMAPYLVGEFDCDWDNIRGLYAQHDIEAFLIANPALLNNLANNATAGANSGGDGAGPLTLSNGTTLSVEEQILLMARAFSIPSGDRGTQSERDRITFQTDKLFDNGSALQFSYMKSQESFQRAQAAGFYYYDPDNVGLVDDGINNTFDFAPGPALIWQGSEERWRILSGMGYPRIPTPSVGDIDEQYAELRWVSPDDRRLRYVVGASFYEYDFIEERWGNTGGGNEPMAYTALSNGIVNEFMELSGFAAAGVPFAADNEIISEEAENVAAFFNVNYDLTDKMTLSVEGRYQSDEVGATNNTTGLSDSVTTDTFVPRISLSYKPTDSSNIYLQWAQGVNPAGINVGVLTTDTLNVLNNGIENGLIPFSDALNTDVIDNATGAPGADGIIDAYDNINDIWYTDGSRSALLMGNNYSADFQSADFRSFREEEMTQIELGFKGDLFDGRLSYSGAIYSIEWKDQIQNGSIDLGSPCADGGEVGDPLAGPCLVDGTPYFYVANTAGSNVNAGLNFGDVDIYGIELETSFNVSDNWNIRAQASFLEAEYDQFCDIALFNATNLSTRPDYLEALDLSIREPGDGDTLTSTCYVTDGNEVAGQPNLSASISPSYSTDIAGMRFNGRLDIRHEGSQYENSGNFNSYPSVTTANLSFGLSSDNWSATLYVNNLFDDNTPRRVFGFPDDVSQMGQIGANDALVLTDFLGNDVPNALIVRDSFSFQARNPRTIGLRANYRF